MTRKRLLISILSTVLVIAAAVAIAVFTKVSVPSDAAAMLAFYTRNKPDAEVTVAVIHGGETEVKAYGHDGVPIAVPDRFYEIGEITRTFTGAVAAKAIADGYLRQDMPVSHILRLSGGTYTPTVFELLTHSSGYSDYSPDVSSSKRSNPYSGIDGNDIVSAMNSFKLRSEPPYLYSDSDFGVAALAAVLSKAYNVDFYSILTLFIRNELNLENTYVSVEGTIADGWQWNYDDAYMASCGLTSNIRDMVSYAKLYLAGDIPFIAAASDPLYEVNADTAIGYLWTVSGKSWVLSQSGHTGHYSSSIVIDKTNGAAVIVLSNYPDDRYGSTEAIAQAYLDEIKA